MRESLTVRQATVADADAVFTLAVGLAITFEPDRAAFDDGYPALLATPEADLLVVEVGGEVVGYLLGTAHRSLIANGAVSWVEELAVAAQHRRRGLGAQLMADFERRALARGSRFVALATTRADAFYAALGYTAHATYFRKLL